ncbi:aldose 1-epimerase family protein [Levilactobacillus namurensis]|uniref:aldose 1-epimerase family protein n=1 Tax=Levilactobacillus namurensis TaxID=380393 RepID=UPI0004638CA8|nr:aldose 1-epimerase family protein [Levilactobacillus namurensis]MCW3777338.1 aldose 1-epimerase family protein [Levilactobacillus namurensis]MDT7018596.1 aldose 1-epimerase family protein [Levilactobacillus namurensis]WNN64424.1 aldose 1-epimerase family protein [Levilactobacillus namurensis]
MFTLKNQYLTVKINPLGAELTSVTDNDSHLEYMWQADKAFWGRHAPFLFPIVGRLQDNQYQVDGQTYQMTQHGFARDRTFTVVDQSATALTLQLQADAQSREKYPFAFKLTVHYTLVDHGLQVAATIQNQGTQTMPWSFGAHPGFNLPLGQAAADFTDYQVTVAPKQVYQRVPLVGPYSDTQHAVPLDLTQPLALKHALFDHDAQILTLNNRETTVMLSTPKDDHGVALTVAAPYLGIWSPYPKQAPFVCLEPWWGLADDVQATGDLRTKVAIHQLAPGADVQVGYQITYF